MSPLGRVLIFAVGSFLLVAAPANAKGPDGKGSSGQQAAPKKAPPTKAAPKKAAPPKKAAESELRAEVLVLHATNAKKGIDPAVGDLPELSKPPFSSYRSYRLIKKDSLALEAEASVMSLPNGRSLRAKLLKKLSADRYRVSVSIDQPGGKAFLPLLEVRAKLGQRFIVAGQSYQGGILVLVITLSK